MTTDKKRSTLDSKIFNDIPTLKLGVEDNLKSTATKSYYRPTEEKSMITTSDFATLGNGI